MELCHIMFLLKFGIFLILTSGEVAASASKPKLILIMDPKPSTIVSFGETILYRFTLKHTTDSAADAANIKILVYLPHFYTQPTIIQKSSAAQTESRNGSMEIQISSLKTGETFICSYTVELSEQHEKKLKYGFHYAVTEMTLIWYDATSEGKPKIKYSIPLQYHSFVIEIPGCSYNLGIESGKIKGHQITASSSTPASQPSRARYSADGWCAATINENQYIQVFLARKTRITKIITWGRSRKPHWITKYTVELSNDGLNWYPYKENGIVKVFDGNKDATYSSTHVLRYTIGFNFVRIRPVSWNIQICFRFELYGCEVSKFDNCVDAIGMESGLIPGAALTNMKGEHSGTGNGRLFKKVVNFPFGWEADRVKEDYLQIDLGSVHKVTRVGIQGSDNDPAIFFVKSYHFAYSNNSLTWKTIKEGSKNKELEGCVAQDAAKFPKVTNIVPPIYARYVRITPKNFQGLKVLRSEIYGCVSEPRPSNKTDTAIPKEFGRRVVLLDTKRNQLYVCVYNDKVNPKSCVWTKDGSVWGAINDVVNIIGYDDKTTALYGIDNHLTYKFSIDGGITWTGISIEEWERRQSNNNIIFATKLEDILVGQAPSDTLSWKASNGKTWGVSGKGVHLKEADAWKLVAHWKCCGF